VLGHSFGGRVALVLALEHVGAPARLVLSCTTPAARLAHPDRPTYTTIEEMAQALFADPADERLGEYLRRRAPEQPRLDIAAAFPDDDTTGFDVEARLGEIRAPTLVLAGARDRIRPLSAAETIADGIPGAQLVVFQRSGHLPFVEEQAAFVDAVREFVLGGG
jgi:proline iminopeptidase